MSGKQNEIPQYKLVQRPCQFVVRITIAATKNHPAQPPVVCGEESCRKIFNAPFCEKHFNQINTKP